MCSGTQKYRRSTKGSPQLQYNLIVKVRVAKLIWIKYRTIKSDLSNINITIIQEVTENNDVIRESHFAENGAINIDINLYDPVLWPTDLSFKIKDLIIL